MNYATFYIQGVRGHSEMVESEEGLIEPKMSDIAVVQGVDSSPTQVFM